MKTEIEQINNSLVGVESVMVEAAHIYADKQPGEEQRNSAVIAAGVSAGLQPRIIRALLIDDYNVTATTLDTNQYFAWLAGYGFAPDYVFMESDLVSDAYELIKELKEKIPRKKLWTPKTNPWKEEHGLAFWTREDKVVLLTRQNRPSCPLLDAALYIRKSRLAGASLTVLPEKYAPQQRASKSILKKLGRNVPIVGLYFGTQGSRVEA